MTRGQEEGDIPGRLNILVLGRVTIIRFSGSARQPHPTHRVHGTSFDSLQPGKRDPHFCLGTGCTRHAVLF